mmetsp:Transcript_36740/g.80039  ORF Transcript_36740/g.80039 Transcript_36740/m.80039 type:complete len:255 (-) Transcript_36740:194-958(-)
MSQHLRVESMELVRRKAPSGLTLMPLMMSVCPLSSITASLLRRSHTRTVLSMPPVYTLSLASAKATAVTWYSSEKVCTLPFTRMSHSLEVPSSDPLTMSCGPLRAGQQLFTNELCSAIFLICFPVCASHARTDASGDAVMIVSPSVVQCKSITALRWPFISIKLSHSPCTFHKKICLSWDPEATTVPDGLNLQDTTASACPLSSMIGESKLEVRFTPAGIFGFVLCLLIANALSSTLSSAGRFTTRSMVAMVGV